MALYKLRACPEQWVSLGEYTTTWGQKDKLGFPCLRHVLFNLPFFSSLTCILGTLRETLRAATIYCRIKTGNSKQRMGRVMNAGSDATLEKRLPVFRYSSAITLLDCGGWELQSAAGFKMSLFSSRSLAALAAIFLHGKICFHRSKTLQSWPVWGRGANPDCQLKAQLDQDQFCHPLYINFSCLYPRPISPRLWGLTETSFHEDCHFQPSQRNHTELRSPMIKSCESGASKFISRFGSQHELHK